MKTKYSFLYLLFAPLLFFSQNKQLIQDYLYQNSTGGNQVGFEIESESYSASMKGTVIKLQQTINAIPVYNAIASVLIKENKVQHFASNFTNENPASDDIRPEIDSKSAFEQIATKFSIDASKYTILKFIDAENNLQNFAKSRLVYFLKDKKAVLSYEFIFPEAHSPNFWNVIADASTGEILHQQNLNLSCNHQNYSNEKHSALQEFIIFKNEIGVTAVPNSSSYNVFALPVESPNFGARTIENNPYSISSSPEAWHSDGINSFTITRGNNVYAYEDADANNIPGFSPDGGSARNFNFPLDLSQPVIYNRSAAITNLFYTGNKSHDIFYRLGFDEKSRNFQSNNFGKGGSGSDAVFAEAQDGSGTNNANFTTPPDGTAPRMQMYLWSPGFVQRLFYNAPAAAVFRQPNSKNANFGPALTPSGITAAVMLVSNVNACSPLPPNSLFQKIGLAERGSCNFTEKVKNIQNAGGVAAIIYNAVNSTNFTVMGGSDAAITIPSILIENSEGIFIKNLLNADTTVNVTLQHDDANDILTDASFDNGIIIHEYSHGVSNRNTGNGYACLDKNISKEQMGEGWSDFFSLMFTNLPDATAAKARSISSFAAGQAADGNGIRSGKYSPDFAINSTTYKDTNGKEITEDGVLKADVHAVGFVWASVLWDLHWKFAEKYGFASDIAAHPESGSAKVVQIVMDALKIQECNPTFTSGRDAIIAADLAINNGKNRCTIWETFAKRGLGVDASAGDKTNINDQIEDFKLPKECMAGFIDSDFYIYPNPAAEEFYLNFPVSVLGRAVISIYDASGRIVLGYNKLVVTSKQKLSSKNLINGVYFIKIRALAGEKTLKLIVAHK